MERESSMQPDAGPSTAGRSVVEIRTTFPSREIAMQCATRLVDRGLAACVQVEGPVTSTYRWQGAMETADEFSCRCKTTVAAAAACEAEIAAVHPYATPEILVTQCLASASYAA